MSFWTWLWKKWVRRTTRSSLKTFASHEIRYLLERTYKNAEIYLADTEYAVPTRQAFMDWLNKDSMDKMRWVKNEWDCDNFALESKCRAHTNIKGNVSYGFVWNSSPAHAYNTLVFQGDKGLQIMSIEPQQDNIPRYPKDKAFLIVM